MTKFDLKNRSNLALLAIVIVIACIAGIYTGNSLSNRYNESLKQRDIDEIIGLGERTGMSGDLALQVNPVNIKVKAGDPINIELALKNNTKKSIKLNNRLIPAPAYYKSNQLPIKQIVKLNGKQIAYKGNIVIYSPQTKKDFITLKPGETYKTTIDVRYGPEKGFWNMLTPGVYTIELWYETYLTGKYIGIKAWTGMTNHVVIKATIHS